MTAAVGEANATRGVMSVFEHQRLHAQDFKYAKDFAWLIAKELSVFGISRVQGRWQLKVGHHIGMIVLPSGMVLEILPKPIGDTARHQMSAAAVQQGRQWVSRMLSDLSQPKADVPKRIQARHYQQFAKPLTPVNHSQPPLSAWLWQQFYRCLLQYRPAASYQNQQVNDSRLQGKLLLREQLQRNTHQPHKFACQISERSHDTLANRFIHSALQLLYGLANRQERHTLYAWWHAIGTLNQQEYQQLTISYQRAQRQLLSKPLNAQMRHAARELLQLSYWLLKHQQPSTPKGNLFANKSHATEPLRLCLLINMNHAFEQWVSGCIHKQLNAEIDAVDTRYQVQYQPQTRWLQDMAGQTHLTVRPDVLVSKSFPPPVGRVYTHVIDVKWKHMPDAKALRAADAYQLMSYAQAYNAPQAWLIYPVIGDAQPTALTHTEQPASATAATLWLIPFDVTRATLSLATVKSI